MRCVHLGLGFRGIYIYELKLCVDEFCCRCLRRIAGGVVG